MLKIYVALYVIAIFIINIPAIDATDLVTNIGFYSGYAFAAVVVTLIFANVFNSLYKHLGIPQMLKEIEEEELE